MGEDKEEEEDGDEEGADSFSVLCFTRLRMTSSDINIGDFAAFDGNAANMLTPLETGLHPWCQAKLPLPVCASLCAQFHNGISIFYIEFAWKFQKCEIQMKHLNETFESV